MIHLCTRLVLVTMMDSCFGEMTCCLPVVLVQTITPAELTTTGSPGARLHCCGAGGHGVLREAGEHAVLHAAVQPRQAQQRALHGRVPRRARVRRTFMLRAHTKPP